MPLCGEMKKITIKMPYHVGDVHLYLTEIAGGLVLFDSGPPLDDAMRCLRENIDFSRLKYVFITHGHIDHVGLAGFLQKETAAQIILPRATAAQLFGKQTYIDNLSRVFKTLGFPNTSALYLVDKVSQINRMANLPEHYLLAEESGELMHSLGIDSLACPWHSQGDLIYLLGNYAILGDVALRGIFPVPLLDVDFNNPEFGRFDNYSAFCTTIDRLKQLQGRTLLPSHNDYLNDLDSWIFFTVSKLLGRARKLLPLYLENNNVYQAVNHFFGSPEENSLMTYLKASEIAFIYDFLKQPEKLGDVLVRQGLYQHVEQKFATFQKPDLN